MAYDLNDFGNSVEAFEAYYNGSKEEKRDHEIIQAVWKRHQSKPLVKAREWFLGEGDFMTPEVNPDEWYLDAQGVARHKDEYVPRTTPTNGRRAF